MQSAKMHRLTKVDLKKACNKYVDKEVIANLNKWINLYNKMTEQKSNETFNCNGLIFASKQEVDEYLSITKNLNTTQTEVTKGLTKYEVYMKIISNCPMGLEQEMSITTNYLQLKTIYHQRKTHKLEEDWGAFCKWIESLPLFKEIAL